MEPVTRLWLFLALAAGLGFAATLVCRTIAIRTGIVCQPRRDRWSSAPVPLLGGLAIVVTTGALLPFVPDLPASYWVLFAGAASMSLVGLVDDRVSLSPYTKLAAQLAAAGAVTALGLQFPLTGIPVVDIVITVLWLVGLSNAFNLLDNMDGLAAGIAAIAALTKASLFVMAGLWPGALVCAVFAGACLGFLALNFHPARIYMGDAGSLFLGFFVAGLGTVGADPDSRATISVLVGPVLIMLVPIFDTTLVTIMRLVAGRPISQGGRDHASHRLVVAGLSERRAVLTLYGLALLSGAVGLLTRDLDWPAGLALIVALAISMLLLGVALARIRVYPPSLDVPSGVRLQGAPGLTWLRQFATAGIDGLLVLAAFYAAGAFDRSGGVPDEMAVRALPIVISAKMIALAIFRTNNRVWRHTNSHDLLAIVQASTAGSALGLLGAVSVLGLVPGMWSLFALDWLLLTTALCGSRLVLRALAEFLRPVPASASRVLIYGAGAAGVALLQEIRSTPSLGRMVVGFLDDDPLMQRTRVQGLPVLGGEGALATNLEAGVAEEVIVSTELMPADRLDRVRATCEAHGARASRRRFAIESIGATAQLRRIR